MLPRAIRVAVVLALVGCAGEVPPTIDVVQRPLAAIFAADSVWVVDRKSLTRIDPRANASLDTVDVGEEPTDVAFGAGSLWVVNWEGDWGLSRVDPKSKRV